MWLADFVNKVVCLKQTEASTTPVSHPVTILILHPAAHPFRLYFKSLQPNGLSFKTSTRTEVDDIQPGESWFHGSDSHSDDNNLITSHTDSPVNILQPLPLWTKQFLCKA